MRLLGLLFGLAVAITPQVSGTILTECYPSCTTFTDPFSGNAIDEKTTWSGSFPLNQFNPQGYKTLLTVTLKTILYFNSSIWITRTTPQSTFTGFVTPGVSLNMDLRDFPTLLGQFWGRFGNYAEFDQDNTNDHYPFQGQNGQDITGISDPGAYSAAPTLFIQYTYPLFDIINATSCTTNPAADALTKCDTNPALPLPLQGVSPTQGGNSGPVWAYYKPSTDPYNRGHPQFFWGQISSGIYVERVDDFTQPTVDTTVTGGDPKYDAFLDETMSQYFTQEEAHVMDQLLKFQFDDTLVNGTETFLGTAILDRWSESLAFTKSISKTDLAGGATHNVTAQSMLDLFDLEKTNTGTGQMWFDAAANGIFQFSFTGGNAQIRQTTYARVAARVEYTYECIGFCGDPQFGGFQGQDFQVHGYPGSYFNLFSAPSFQMNGRFAYLATGHCNYHHTPCWTHPGTYIDDLTFVVDELLIRITAGSVDAGYTVLINDEPYHAHKHVNESDSTELTHTDVRPFIPTKFYDPNTRLSLHLKSSLELVVRTELVSFVIHNADYFFNVDSQLLVRPILKMGRHASMKFPHPITGKPDFPDYPLHGFIGQTWANKIYPGKKQYQGEPDDYLESRPYATESLYSQYHKHFDDTQTQWD